MGIKTTVEKVERDVVVDITCDICGLSTKDKFGMNYEYSHLIANWGYGSGRDDESWDYYICENCSERLLTLLRRT